MPPSPSAAVLARAFGLWGAEAGQAHQAHRLGGSNCHIYALGAADAPRILRLVPDVGEPGRVQAEVDWMRDLAERGAPVCGPFRSRRGRLLEPIDDESGRYLAAVFRRARGHPVNSRHPTIWSPRLFELCGRTLGEIHALGRDFAPRPGARRDEWHGPAFLDLARRTLPGSETALLRRFDESCGRLAELPRERGGFGLIHGDFHQGNYWLHDERLEVFDFGDCSYAWYAYDIAVSFYTSLLSGVYRGEDAGPELMETARTYVAHFFRGYTRSHPLDPAWIEQVPHFLRFYNLLVLVALWSGGRTEGRLFEFAGRHARADRPCIDLDFGTLYRKAGEAG